MKQKKMSVKLGQHFKELRDPHEGGETWRSHGSLGETEGETETERDPCWSSYRMGEKKGDLRNFCFALLTGFSQMNVIH